MRNGATANGILLAGDATLASPSSLAALHFFLSGRSAYVDGQFLEVTGNEGELPES
ncbi:3-oxoacyl-ACP reductase, partial [Glutamicibacter creatinolyticus]